MLKSADRLIVQADAPLMDALAALERSEVKTLFVVDDAGKLVGACTDGDIRRAMLRGGGMTDAIEGVMNRTPVRLEEGFNPGDAAELLRKHDVMVLPVVGADGGVKGIVTADAVSDDGTTNTPVVLMAGGLGQRLRPLTETCPKPLLPLGDKPILGHIIDGFVAQGFRRFYISVNYLGHMIEQYFGTGQDRGIEISYLREEKRLGTAGALHLLPQNMDYPFIVMNGDVITQIDFRALLRNHEEAGAAATMCVREHLTSIPFGVVRFGGSTYQYTDEKPTLKHHINAGIYCISKEARNGIPENKFYDMPSLFDDLHKQDHLCSVHVIHDAWFDIGSPGEYEIAKQRFRES